MRIAAQRNLLRQEPAFFEENRPSEIASRMTADTAIIEQVVGSTVSVALRNLLTGLGGIIYLFTLAPKLAALLLLGIPDYFAPADLYRAKGSRLYRARVRTGWRPSAASPQKY